MYFLIRVLINAAGLWVAAAVVPGISVTGSNVLLTYLVVAVVLKRDMGRAGYC